MDVAPLVLLAALVYKFTSFLKALRNQDWNAALTQLVVWAGGVIAVLLFAQTEWAESVAVGASSLADLEFWSQFVLGLEAASLTSAFYDLRKGFDGSDSAREPALFMDSTPTPPS
jgi:hypothetical protein